MTVRRMRQPSIPPRSIRVRLVQQFVRVHLSLDGSGACENDISSIRYADKLKFDGSLSLRAELTIGKKWQSGDCQGYIEVERHLSP